MTLTTKRVQFFCLPDEMVAYVRDNLYALDSRLFVEVKSPLNSSTHLVKIDVDEFYAEHRRIGWIIPDVSEDVVSVESFLGLVQITFPAEIDKKITTSSIALKCEIGNLNSNGGMYIYTNLVKYLKGRLISGLWAVNENFGGESFYKNYYISPRCIESYRSGIELIHDESVKNVKFEYRG